jgi:hypothetical protein
MTFDPGEHRELRLIRSQVNALPADVQRVGFQVTPYNLSMSGLVIGDEFGLPTTSHTVTQKPLVLLLLSVSGRLKAGALQPIVDVL